MERVLDAGPIPYAEISLAGDPDLEHGLRHFGVEPETTSYRLIEIPVRAITDTQSMPIARFDQRPYADAIAAGQSLPPVVVFRNWKGPGWGLLDGMTRTNAFVACGVERTLAYELLDQQRPRGLK